MTLGSSARIAWFATAGAATERDRPAPTSPLPPPDRVRAVRGRGHVTVDWLAADDGRLELHFDLPMPAISLIELVPV